jgi:hypothetical protein
MKKLPPKCQHCGAREPLDDGDMCRDYEGCIARKPLAGTFKPKPARMPEAPLEGQKGTLGPDMDEGDPEMEAWMDSLPPVDIDKLARELKQAEVDNHLPRKDNHK